MLPVEGEGYVTFEWIGFENYLQERLRPGSRRTRGANFTSADAVVAFRTADGNRVTVLIEWKYTESYTPRNLRFSSRGTDRLDIYRSLLEAFDSPITMPSGIRWDALFVEPFYQLMRQQLLADQMERHKEAGASTVRVVHVSPAANRDFARITSDQLAGLGTDATSAWKSLLRRSDRFIPIHTENLFAPFLEKVPSSLESWRAYVIDRFDWLAVRRHH